MSARIGKKARQKQVFNLVGYVLLGLGLASFLFLVFYYDVTQDDTYITCRYAANYLNGDGLVFNIGERVEGYTNFLWTLFIIIAGWIGLKMVLSARLLGILLGVTNIVLIFILSREILISRYRKDGILVSGFCAFLTGTLYSYAYWAGAGLETAAFALILTLFVWCYLKKPPLALAVAIASVLVRPEGLLLVIILVLGDAFGKNERRLGFLTVISLAVLFLGPLVLFKYYYYNSLLPNTFYAKTQFSPEQLLHGLTYTGRFFFHYSAAGIFLIPALIVITRPNSRLRFPAFLLLIFTLYIIVIGGDVLKVHRFFVPLIGLFLIVMVHGFYLLFKRRGIFMAACLAVLIWQLLVPRDYVNAYHFQEKGLADKLDQLMTELLKSDQSNFTLAVSTIGLVGYRLMGHQVIDLLGLTDTTIARHPEEPVEGLETTWRESKFNSKYVLSRQPDYVLFSTGYKPSAPAERALFLYSAFLNSYRIINFTFYYGGDLHSIYKRYYPITGEIKRDVDVRFVQSYNRAINLSARDRLEEALRVLDTTRMYSPKPPYPYIRYFRAEMNRRLARYEFSYELLKDLVSNDTLVYDAYEDLYIFEIMSGNDSAAAFYRRKLENLVPWRVREVDYLLSKAREHKAP